MANLAKILSQLEEALPQLREAVGEEGDEMMEDDEMTEGLPPLDEEEPMDMGAEPPMEFPGDMGDEPMPEEEGDLEMPPPPLPKKKKKPMPF